MQKSSFKSLDGEKYRLGSIKPAGTRVNQLPGSNKSPQPMLWLVFIPCVNLTYGSRELNKLTPTDLEPAP